MYPNSRNKVLAMVLTLSMGSISQTPAFGGIFDMVSGVSSLYNNVKAGTMMYHSYDLVKTIRTAEPLFKDYDNVMVRVQINPREDVDGHDISAAFEKNVRYIIEKDTETSGDYLKVCELECEGRTLVLQFKETGYNSNIVQKLTVGDKLRGELYYMDHDNAEVLKIEKLEMSDDYAGLLREIHMSVISKILKSMSEQGGRRDKREMRGMVEEYNAFDPVMPEYRELFVKRS